MHKPGHLRDGFVALIEGDEDAEGLFFYDSAKQEQWERMTAVERLWMSGQLWNCTDFCQPFTAASSVCHLGRATLRQLGASAKR